MILITNCIDLAEVRQKLINGDEITAVPMRSDNNSINREAVLSYIDHILGCGMGKAKSFEYIRKFVEKLPPETDSVPDGLLTYTHGGWITAPSE